MSDSFSSKISSNLMTEVVSKADARLNRLAVNLNQLGIHFIDHQGFLSIRIKSYQLIMRSMELINFEKLDFKEQQALRIELANGRIFILVRDNLMTRDIYNDENNIIHLAQVEAILNALGTTDHPLNDEIKAVNIFLNNFRELGLSIPSIKEHS